MEFATVFDSLDWEWARLGRSRDAARRLPEVCAAAGDARLLVDVERYVRAASPADADRVLLALVARAVDGDDLAARVLLQLLLPGARSLARRWWAVGDAEERAAVAVGAVYQRIRSYPLARRPGKVAANILMDAARELRRAVPRTDIDLVGDATDQMVAPPQSARGELSVAAHPALELVDVLSDAVNEGVIGAVDAELIARSRIAGERMEDLAAGLNLKPRTVWSRRQQAETALASSYEPAVA
jgi:hypothetical protein